MATECSPANQQKRLAVLIDADNAQAAIAGGLFEEIAKYGIASVKRMYGDWTSPQMVKWKHTMLEHSIQPIQQFAYTKGKNATDSSLIIDAMDLLYTRRFDGFCLVSSDSDFTRLAARLREEGMVVYGFGKERTPKPFASACDRFFYTEFLRVGQRKVKVVCLEGEGAKSAVIINGQTKIASNLPESDKRPEVPVGLIASLVEDISHEDGWAYLGSLGSVISERYSDFDSRRYGHKKLSDLIRSQSRYFELKKRCALTADRAVLSVRNKSRLDKSLAC